MDGGRRADQADLPSLCDSRCRLGAGADDVNVGHGKGLSHAAGHRAHRAAGSQHRLYVLREEKVHVLAGIAQNGLLPPRAIGHPAGVAKVNDALAGQQLFQLLNGGQAPQARVEHADGAVIHGWSPSFSQGLSCPAF